MVFRNAFKTLDDTNLFWLLLFYNWFWHSQSDFDEWHEGSVFTVSKKGDTSNSNKWREVTLMDIGNKIYISIIYGKIFKIIRKHGVKL